MALNAILDVDEFLFAGMTPVRVQRAVQNIKPMRIKYSRRRSQYESGVHLTSLLVLVLTSHFVLLAPLTDTMLDVKNELCGGIQTFVVSYNTDTQQTIGLATAPSRNARNLSATEFAVLVHKDSSPDAISANIRFSSDVDMFRADTSRSMKEEASMFPFCAETMVLNEGGQWHTDPVLRPLTDMLLTSAANHAGLPGKQGCEELRHLCDQPDSRLLRMMCGETCGCLDPLGIAWFRVEAQGCSSACLEIGRRSLQNHTCEDSPMDDRWRAFWTAYPTVVSLHVGQELAHTAAFPEMNQTMHAMLIAGCPALLQHPSDFITGTVWCKGHPDLLQPLAPICPQTCGCDNPTPDLASHCPPRCISDSA